eukprot:Rmarinus@m.29407
MTPIVFILGILFLSSALAFGKEVDHGRVLPLVFWARKVGMQPPESMALTSSHTSPDISISPTPFTEYRYLSKDGRMLPNHLILKCIAEGISEKRNSPLDISIILGKLSKTDFLWAESLPSLQTGGKMYDVIFLGRLYFETVPDSSFDTAMRLRGLLEENKLLGSIVHPDMNFEDFVVDKGTMMVALQNEGLPVVPTVYYRCGQGQIHPDGLDEEFEEHLLSHLKMDHGSPFIAKPSMGSMSSGFMVVPDWSPDSLRSLHRHVSKICSVEGWPGVLLQAYHPEALRQYEFRMYFVDGMPTYVCGTTHVHHDRGQIHFWRDTETEMRFVQGDRQSEMQSLWSASRQVLATLLRLTRQHVLPWVIRIDFLATKDGYRVSEVEFPPFLMPNCVSADVQGDPQDTIARALVNKADEITAWHHLETLFETLGAKRSPLQESLESISGISFAQYKKCMRNMLAVAKFEEARDLRDGKFSAKDLAEHCFMPGLGEKMVTSRGRATLRHLGSSLGSR